MDGAVSGLQTVEYYGRGAGGKRETAPGRAFGSALLSAEALGNSQCLCVLTRFP